MGVTDSFRPRVLSLGLLLAAGVSADAQVFQASVEVEKPPAMASELAYTLAVQPLAQRALLEKYIEQLSPGLLAKRGEEVHDALEPLDDLLTNFDQMKWTDTDQDRLGVLCRADIDTARVLQRLVERKVLSFRRQAPRLLLVPAPDTSREAFQALRVRMSNTLSLSGITVLAAEVVSAPGMQAGRFGAEDRRALAQAALDARAHFVAAVSVAAARAPAPGGLVVLDGTIQYTLLRMYDAAILDEKVFTARGGGGSPEMAMQHILEEAAPPAASSLAGGLISAILSNGRLLDTIVINVRRTPSPAATAAFVSVLRDRGYQAALGQGRESPRGEVPVESLVVEGQATVEELFALLANVKFGPGNKLSASVYEHGISSLGLEILDGSTVPTSAAIRIGGQVTLETQRRPSPREKDRAAGVQGQVRPPISDPKVVVAAQGAAHASIRSPLELELDAVFNAALVAGKVSVR